MKVLRSMILILSFLSLTLAFQNCGKVSPDVAFTKLSSTQNSNETEDNGHPYDGKIYVLTGDVCPDGTRIRARIVVKNEKSADLVRTECKEIAPVALTEQDFQINPGNTSELQFQNQTFFNQLVGAKIDMSLVSQEIGYCYWLPGDFGTPSDDDTYTAQSRLQIYEDGKPLGPAHTIHDDIRNIGLGRFSHWKSYLRFSSSDNTNPITNGRTYTYEVL